MKSWIKKIGIITIVVAILMLIGGVYIYNRPYTEELVIKKNNGTCQYIVYGDHAEFYKYTGNDAEVVIQDKVLGREVTRIMNIAFMKNEYIQSVKCPKYLKEISYAAFYKCKLLCKVELNEELEVIEENAFQGCPLLKEIEIYENVKRIGARAFCETGIENVVLHSNNVYIDLRAFGTTPWLDRQEGFAILGDNILVGYQGTEEEVVVPYGVKVLSASFYDDKEIKEVYLPNTVESILSDTFWWCEDVTVYIPDSVKDISGLQIKNAGKLTIVTTAGSYAESFAKENDIEYEIVDEIIYPEVN